MRIRSDRVIEFENELFSVDWSPDGTRLAAGDSAGGVEVLTSEGLRLWRRNLHQGITEDIRWSPDGRQIVSASSGTELRVWDAVGGMSRFISSVAGLRNTSVSWSPDNQRLAWSNDSVFFFDANTGEEIDRWSNPGKGVRSLAWSPDGRYLALGLFSGEICIVDGRNLEEIATLRGHTNYARWLTWSPDGRLLASAACDGTLRIWEILQRRCRKILDGHTNEVQSVSWSSKGDLLASGSSDCSIRLWDAQSGQQIVQLNEHQGIVWCVIFSPDGTRLASASRDKTVRIWGVSALVPEVANLEPPNLDAYSARQVATVGRRAASREVTSLWVPGIREWKGSVKRSASGVALSKDGRTAVAGFGDGSLRHLDLATGLELWKIERAHRDVTHDVAISSPQELVASSSADQTVGIWELDTGRLATKFTEHTGSIWASAFSPVGDLIASASSDKTVKVWCPASGELIRTFVGHGDHVKSVDWHPDGQLLASSSADSTVRIWDVDKEREVHQHSIHTAWVWSVSWSPDGELLASTSDDKTIVIWSLKHRQEVARLRGHHVGVSCVVWSPDGRLVVSGGDDSTIRLWNPTKGQEIHRFEYREEYAWRLSWAASGAFLAASLGNETVRFFDVRDFVQDRQRAYVSPLVRNAMARHLKPLPGTLAHLFRLGLTNPLSLLHSLLELLAGTTQDEILVPLRTHPNILQLIELRWPRVARTGLLALLLRHLPRDARFVPPAGTTPAELRDALDDALRGKPIEPQAPTLPVAALLQAADSLDERHFTLLQLLGPDAVAADPGLPLRLLPQVPKLPPLTAPKRRLLGLRVDLDSRGPAHGHGPGAERTGLDLRGDLRGLLPSQFALPDSVLRARYHRGDLLYRTRDGQEPPKLRPTVILLDVSPPTFGPIEATTRLAAHAVATSLLEARLPVVLVLAGGRTEVRVLERPSDLVEIWTVRSLEPANEVQALCLARAMAENLADGVLRPVVLLLSHPFFAADGSVPELPSLRGLFVQYPKVSTRPAMAEVCERWSSVSVGEAGGLEQHLGELVG